MVATVGSISIDLSSNTQKFTAGFKNAATTVDQQSKRMSASVGGIQKSFSKLSGLVGSFGAGLAGGAAFAGLTSFTGLISKAREAIGRLDDIADRARTSGIGTDLLQSLEHGAQQAGLEVTDLAGGLSFFAKGMGQASEGTGRLYAGLLKLNPELLRNVLNAQNQEERLKLVADALDKTRDAAKRAALSAALFGDVDFGRLFEGGAKAIDAMVKKAKDLDQVVSAEDIKRAGEYDTALNDIEKSTGKAVDALVINLGDALVGTAKLFEKGIEGAGNYIRQVKELALTLQAFEQDPSGKNLADFLLGPKGGGSVAGFFRDLIAGVGDTRQSFAELQQEVTDTEIELAKLYEAKRQGFPVDDDIAKTAGHLDYLNSKLRETNELFAINQKRSALAQQFRAAENASMAGLPSGRLPTVHYAGGQQSTFADPDVVEEVRRAVEKETEATNRVAARTTDVYRGVQQFDSHTAGYFDQLGSSLGGGFRDMATALQSIASMDERTRAAASGKFTSGGSARFSGNASFGGNTSWEGRSMTFAGPSEADTAYYNSVFGGRKYRVGGEDASSITSGGTTSAGNISVVNNIVLPSFTGGRLSPQSVAELKQAAGIGANQALRSYFGR